MIHPCLIVEQKNGNTQSDGRYEFFLKKQELNIVRHHLATIRC